MRPETDDDSKDLFECYGCGHRLQGPPSKACPECGGVLKNIALSRDL